MYKTAYGNFSGENWEGFCQICFKLKYEEDGYQEMPAWQGDLGIEGFTRSGIVFQCYCPDMEYNPDKLYEVQRDKISTDLTKLTTYQKELKSYLKDTKISKWIFVTPEYKKKDLVKHCATKAEELRKLNNDILASDFDVLVYDIEFFAEQIPIVLEFRKQKIDIASSKSTEEEIADWKSQEITLVDHAITKHGQRVSSLSKKYDENVNRLTQNTISDFLNGDIMVRKWKENFQDQYEKFIQVIAQFEKRVENKCAVSDGKDNNGLYDGIEQELKEKLKESFTFLDDLMIDRLTDYVMSDWILRCPISFE
jgi:hypothetical protein